jgi:replicative DNA helicase Mcm
MNATQDHGISIYKDRKEELITWLKRDCKQELTKLCQQYPSEKRTLFVDWNDLFRFDMELADLAVSQPKVIKETLAAVVKDAAPQEALIDDRTGDRVIKGEQVEIAFTNIEEPQDVTTLVRGDRVGELVTLRGKVTKATDTRPKPTIAGMECGNCGVITRQAQPIYGHETPDVCSACENARGEWNPDLSESEWDYHQLVRVKHEPGESDADSWIDVHILGEQAGSINGGESVDITGVLQDVWPDGIESATPEFIIEADHVRKHESDFESIDVRSHKDRIEALASGEEGDPYELLTDSIAPGIFGGETMDRIKLALACQLFGAPRVEKADGTSFRGDIHQLLVGAPGTGKSSLQDAIAEYSPKVATISGKNATKAGVTAAAVRDEFGDTEWSIEAGAFVQANKGLCIVDELDKVDGDVLDSLHSALERQQLSIAKAGINADLQCHTALLGAANPEHERFIDETQIVEQIPVGPAMRTRLDSVFVLRDPVNEDKDAKKVESMLNSIASGSDVSTHGFDESDKINPPLDREEIQAWVAFARQHHTVTFDMDVLKDRIGEYYAEIRMQSADTGAPVNIRKVGSVLRYALASARIRLGDTVTNADIDRAIDIVATSLAQIGMTDEGKLSMDVEIANNVNQATRKEQIKDAIRMDALTISEINDVTGISESDIEAEIENFKRKGDAIEPQTGEYRLV